MTVQEAIDLIKQVPLYRYECELQKGRQSDLFKALNKAIEIMEKQIPKKPIVQETTEKKLYKCPCCDGFLMEIVIQTYGLHQWGRKVKYCANCGQKLDWEEGGTID